MIITAFLVLFFLRDEEFKYAILPQQTMEQCQESLHMVRESKNIENLGVATCVASPPIKLPVNKA